MNDSLFNEIQDSAKYLNLDLMVDTAGVTSFKS